MLQKLVYSVLLIAYSSGIIYAQQAPTACKAHLTADTLVLENGWITRRYLWNGGNPISISLTDQRRNYTWTFDRKKADLFIPGYQRVEDATFKVRSVEQNEVVPFHLEVEITGRSGSLQIKRIFRIYPDCPAIACDYYIRGKASATWDASAINNGDMSNVEKSNLLNDHAVPTTVLERLTLNGKHWRVKTVEFFDITDRNNNLVRETDQLAYVAESRLQGNLLFANDALSGEGLFVLKEAPPSSVQLAYPGFDFTVRTGELLVNGLGIAASEVDSLRWTRCYGYVTGVTSDSEIDQLSALRLYQNKIRIHKPKRDDMVMMNTWGDRNQDKQISETFIIRELEYAHRLGITHFQIDDGWQTGKSSNSAFQGGSLTGIWNSHNYWTPDSIKFPNGLTEVVRAASQLGIEVCLWFNPSKDHSYANWQKDAGALISLYHKYGIRTFKIDGVQINDKTAEINFRGFLDTVMKATSGQVVFNLDVTAGRRNGYHYFNEYGNIFLENRYTDWGNYYPYWTLRNLWMLSKYVPPQNLQIEFLNNFRNRDKYDRKDPLAPGKIPFEYTFAITMMAQPLAWMEATGLPEQAFNIAQTVRKYLSLQQEIHKGLIFPVGEEPNGMTWTGFQSILKNGGYLLVFRENTPSPQAMIKTWLPKDRDVELIPMIGSGKKIVTKVSSAGEVKISLDTPNSYALYKYILK